MKNLVSVNLKGGLGNYLFQIACVFDYSLKHNKHLILDEKLAHAAHNKISTYKDNVLLKLEFENFEIDVAARLRNHLERPIKGEMPRASMYRIMRSEVMNSVLELFSKLTFVESPYIYEVAGEFAVAASGQTTTVEELYWIRNWQNRMVQHTNWDRSLSLSDWWIDSENIHKRNSVVELLSEYAKIGLSETQRILNIYMARRVLVEEKGNKQVGNLWHALSVIKQGAMTTLRRTHRRE